MRLRVTDDPPISAVVDTEFTVSHPFRKVLLTLPDKTVPYALFSLGILSKQLEPIEADSDLHVNSVEENIREIPPASLPPATVQAIEWLLSECGDSLEEERKKTVGSLIRETNLNIPGSRDGEKECINNTIVIVEPEQDETSNTDRRNSPNKTSDSATEISSNEEAVSGESVACDFCEKEFKSEGEVISHSIHCSKRPSDALFKCEYCGNKYVSKQALSNHLESCNQPKSGDKHNKNSYDCDICGAEFERVSNLLEHKFGHSREGGAQTTSESGSYTKQEADTTKDSEFITSSATGTIGMYKEKRGYGFVVTLDVETPKEDGVTEVFFHISNVRESTVEEGDRLKFDIIRTEEGPEAKNAKVIQQNKNRDSYEKPEDDAASRLGFGNQVDDTKYGPDVTPTQQNIESFGDDRKFR